MALRSIDNALPSEIERPRKMAKIGSPSPIAKSKAPVLEEVRRDSCKNEENSPIQVPIMATEQSVEYVSSLDLKPLVDPEITIKVNLVFQLYYGFILEMLRLLDKLAVIWE